MATRFVGLDWGDTRHQLYVLDAGGWVLDQGGLSHDIAGLAALEERLARHAPLVGVAIERGEGLLVERLQQGGHRLFCVSPKLSAGPGNATGWRRPSPTSSTRTCWLIAAP